MNYKRTFRYALTLAIMTSISGCDDSFSIDNTKSAKPTRVSDGSETRQPDDTANTEVTPANNVIDNTTPRIVIPPVVGTPWTDTGPGDQAANPTTSIVDETPWSWSDTSKVDETPWPWPTTSGDDRTAETSDDSDSKTAQSDNTDDSSQANDGTSVENLDVLTFGDSSSEESHGLESLSSEIINGVHDEQARRLLPLDPKEIYGGHLTFNMTVDPKKRNYVSVKFWGDDGGNPDIGRIYLYVIQDGKEYQVAYRHEGDYVPLSVAGWSRDLPGRFFYSTTMLPLAMTQGKSSITLRLVSTGRLYPLGKGGPPHGNYQYNMSRPSRGIYRAYTHTDAYLNVSDETQPQLPESKAKPGPGDEVLEPEGAFTRHIGDWIWQLMQKSPDKLGSGDIAYLSKAYNVPETYVYQSEKLLEKVVAAIDAYATRYYTSHQAGGWGGAYGYIGRSINYLGDALKPYYDTQLDYGEGGTLTRRQAWGDLLFASRESGRFSRSSRSLTNQAMIANGNIYFANKGLLHVGDSRAFAEEDAQRYIKEACGILPWLGSDMPDGGSHKEFGSSYHLVTKKGQTRERGYVGDSYGEMAFHVAEWYEASGSEALRKQAAKMLKARAPFRRPSVELDKEGNAYRLMKSVSPLAWRGAPESDGELASAMSYADRPGVMALRVAGATGDPTLLSYARTMLDDNRYFASLIASKNNARALEALDVFKDYKVLQETEDTGERLPMADTESNYAWADEENAIVALKHGNERLWVSAYWQAKYGINSVGRFLYSTSSYEQYGVLETIPLVQTDQWYTRPSWLIDKPEGNQWAPPKAPQHAYGGERLPMGNAPDDSKSISPFRGKADFYSFRFGHFYAGINAHPSKSFELMPTNDMGYAEDLFTGEQHSDSVTVAPQTSVAFYLDAEADAKPLPATPMWINSVANGTEAEISWIEASGADHYSVERATEAVGPFKVVGDNIESTQFTDKTLPKANTTYFYRVIAHSEGGPGYPSMTSTPLFYSLPDGWTDSNIGGGSSGTTLYDAEKDELIVSGTGWDIGSKGDSFHFTHKAINGDATLLAKLTDKRGGTNRNKVGLMIRESLTGGSKTAIVMLDTAAGYARFAARGGTNKDMGYQNYPAAGNSTPKWLKIERAGDVITGYVSEDGEDWQEAGHATVRMGAEAHIGFAVAPRSSSNQVKAHFKVIE